MKIRSFLYSFIGILLLIIAPLAAGQEKKLKPVPDAVKAGFESITADDALNYVEFLSCDELEGRDTGLRGMRIARNYVASLFRLWGLQPAGDRVGDKQTFHQVIRMMEVVGSDCSLEVSDGNKKTVFNQSPDISMGRGGSGTMEISAPVVFVGYGISAPDLNYDDLAGVDLKGKIALVINGIPGGEKKKTPFTDPKNSRRFSGYYRFRAVAEALRERGAAAVMSVGDFDGRSRGVDGVSEYKQGSRIDSPNRRLIVPELNAASGSTMSTRISEQVADALLAGAGLKLDDIRAKIDDELKPHSQEIAGIEATLSVETEMKPITSGNVLGLIEGSDPELKNEVIVIGGHLDHLGMTEDGYVFNGADDNASGSAGVMEAAQAFALNPVKPKRSILFACWTGEEKGLYGSRYFVEFPSIDKKIIACLNMDMISRDWDPERLKMMARRMGGAFADATDIDAETAKRVTTASMSAQSPELLEKTNRLNKDHVGLIYFPRSSVNLSGGSDHAPFHGANIPAIFFFAAMTEDYHQPGDTADKMNIEKMRDIIRLAYLTAFEIANQPETIGWTEVAEEETAMPPH
ncbi:MAG TPA: M20/M25/M40 family metallo-hydrolase [Acidobacteriota bacterium]|nr:M20/M25/M40 family metallo-hydrolase [Acidobacteriota bacterium]